MAEPIQHKRHGKYLIELGSRPSKYDEIEFPLWGVQGKADFNGANFSVGGCLITRPVLMGGDPHTHEFDQVLFLFGADFRNIQDFDAEIEMFLGDRTQSFNYAACIHVPAGTTHGRLHVKKVNKPVFYMDVTLAPSESDRPRPGTAPRQ
jgi:hypothetical protein